MYHATHTELNNLIQQQQDAIEAGDYEVANDIQHDINFVRNELQEQTADEFAHII